MTRGERLTQAEFMMGKLDVLNCRIYAHSEGEEDFLEDALGNWADLKPGIWEYKDGNRTQCYSNMYSKLLLTYLVSEIKEGNLLTMEFLDKVAEQGLETWLDFQYDEKGYKMSGVLERIVEEVITCSGIFKSQSVYVDAIEVYEAHHMKIEAPEVVKKCLVEAMPVLDKYIDLDNNKYLLLNLDWAAGGSFEFEMGLEVVESELLYEIYEKESQKATEEGALILSTCKECLLDILQDDFMNENLQWEIIDHKERVIMYCGVTCSELIGDDCRYGMEVCDRLHKYKYQYLFTLLELQKWMLDYKKKYLV